MSAMCEVCFESNLDHQFLLKCGNCDNFAHPNCVDAESVQSNEVLTNQQSEQRADAATPSSWLCNWCVLAQVPKVVHDHECAVCPIKYNETLVPTNDNRQVHAACMSYLSTTTNHASFFFTQTYH